MFLTIVGIAQGFLARFFFAAGLPKVIGKGLDRWVGFDEIPKPVTIVIGVAEVAAALGLVVPLVADTVEWTTPLAALGIAVISLMASGFHIRAHESLAALETALWASIAIAIALARWDEFSAGPEIPTETDCGRPRRPRSRCHREPGCAGKVDRTPPHFRRGRVALNADASLG